MKIKIPYFFEDYNLTEGQKIFAAVLQLAMQKEGKKTQFYFHMKDVRIMLGHRVAGTQSIPMLPFLAEFHIGEWTDGIWSFKVKQKMEEFQTGPKWIFTEIESQQSHKMYYYLMGRLSPWNRMCKPHAGILDMIENGQPSLTHYCRETLNFDTNFYELGS